MSPSPGFSPAAALVAAPPPKKTLLGLLGRHQLASVASTTVDFGTMTLAVEVLHLSPVVGTLCGAFAGALTNFQLGRRWIFDAHRGPVLGQALRYAVVSGASAGWNALGEYVLVTKLGLHYFLARALVAVAVSLLWNFPMQRYFVFKHGKDHSRETAQ